MIVCVSYDWSSEVRKSICLLIKLSKSNNHVGQALSYLFLLEVVWADKTAWYWKDLAEHPCKVLKNVGLLQPALAKHFSPSRA